MKKLFITVTALLLLSGCRKERMPADWMTDDSNQPLTAEKVKVERPMFVNFQAKPDMSVPPVQCLPAEYGIILGGGTFIYGTATHVGKVDPLNSYTRLKVCNMAAGLAAVITMNQGQLAAANGDLMFFQSEETTSLITGAMGGVVTITGGTGRFTGATGSVTIKGRVNFTNGTLVWTGSGTITY